MKFIIDRASSGIESPCPCEGAWQEEVAYTSARFGKSQRQVWCRDVEDIYQFAIEVGRAVVVEPSFQGEEGWELPRLVIYDDYLE